MFEKVYQLHEHGRDLNGEVRCWGRNSRLDNIQAAILDIRLKRFDEVIARRRAVAGIYNDLLNTVPRYSYRLHLMLMTNTSTLTRTMKYALKSETNSKII